MIEFPFRNPLDFLLANHQQRPDSIAYIFGDNEYSYADIMEAVLQKAGWLRQNGVEAGTVAAVYSDDDFVVMTSLYAIWALGATAVPLNVTQPPDTILGILQTVEPEVVLHNDDFPQSYSLPCLQIAPIGPSAAIDGFYDISPDDTCIIMFTSGTSGVPKAVPMTFRALGHNCFETALKLDICPDDRILINSPPYYTSAIVHNLTMFSCGASVVVDRSLLLSTAIFDIIRQYGCTGFGGVPVHFIRIQSCLEEAEKPKSLRFLMNSGEHLPTPLLLSVRESLPSVEIFCVYGLTEVAGRLCILSPKDLDKKAGSVGFPLPGMNIAIRDEDGNLLGPGESGQIFVQGLSLLKGYLKNPHANQNSLTQYGFATGDFGYLDSDGYLFIEGRSDDIIKVGGEKVSLRLIEEMSFNYPPFKEIMVGTAYNDLMGNIPALYYVLNPGERINKRELKTFLKGKLPANHIPPVIQEVDEIPRASSGKKLRSFFAKIGDYNF